MSVSKEDLPRLLTQQHNHAKSWLPVFFYMFVWYTSSLGCLLLNKTILDDLGASSSQLGLCQMLATASLGAVKVWAVSFGWGGSGDKPMLSRKSSNNLDANASSAPTIPPSRKKELYLTIVALATLRMFSVLLGLVSLKHVPASFTETVKSTAPFFTVYLQHLVLGMRTSPQVLCSLLPVMAGLVLCAHSEVSFDAIGFWAAVSNNIIDCLQNVVSKKTLDLITPTHLQFYTSCIALAMQVPFTIMRDVRFGIVMDPRIWNPIFLVSQVRDACVQATSNIFASRLTALYYAADLACYHAQSISAYFVVASLTPVSVSVANTLKRSLLIALSVAYFGNEMTWASALGVLIVIAGVFLYNAARTRFPPMDENLRHHHHHHSRSKPRTSDASRG